MGCREADTEEFLLRIPRAIPLDLRIWEVRSVISLRISVSIVNSQE